MSKDYHHLTQDQRCQLYTLLNRGDSKFTIARLLGVHRSTIYREIIRNKGRRGYRYKQAHQRATTRRERASRRKSKLNETTRLLIEEKLRLQWSPEQISGWMKRNGDESAVSHEWIYRYVWANKLLGGSLYKELRHHGKKYNKRGSGKSGRGCIPNRVDISERPRVVEDKVRVGDWELDTIVGRGHKGAIVSIVERASKLTCLRLIASRKGLCVEEALMTKLSLLKEHVLTLTSDNGKEFSCHEKIAASLEADFYFATPYHSWERGLNEHTNGLVRQYIPKSKSFLDLSQEEVENVEILLNNRPRKVLDYMTPIEAFERLKDKHSNVALQS